MNDYFLKILIQERQIEIMEDYRGTRPLLPEWLFMACGLRHILCFFLPTGRKPDLNQSPGLDKRSST